MYISFSTVIAVIYRDFSSVKDMSEIPVLWDLAYELCIETGPTLDGGITDCDFRNVEIDSCFEFNNIIYFEF